MDICNESSTAGDVIANETSVKTSDFPACLNCSNDGKEDEENSSKILVAIMTTLLAFVILIGNGLIIVSVTVVRKLRQPANYLIVSLAFSDFLVAIVVLPPTIVVDILGEWVLGPTMCNIYLSFDVICCAASILNLVMISIDRYLMVTRPLQYPKVRTAKLMVVMICTAWTLACLVIFPALFGFTKNVVDDPDWIPIKPSGGFWNNATYPPPPPEFYNLSYIRDNRTYWTPYKNSSDVWQFSVNLEHEYRLTKVRFSGASDSLFDFQLHMVTQNQGEILKSNFSLTNSEVGIIQATPATCLRLFLDGSEGSLPNNTSFAAFGELIRGKNCLISQQKWYTIYSTVCSFYIPLSVMLFMYYKIYLEASRFKARHRKRSKSLTDQPHSIFSQSLRRKQFTTADDSGSDISDFHCSGHDISPKKETVVINLSPIKSLPPDEAEFCNQLCDKEEQADILSQLPRDSCLQLQDAGSEHSVLKNGEKETDTLLDEPRPFEVNGNIPSSKSRQSLSRDGTWCKTLHYSSGSICRSDNSGLSNHNQTNGTKNMSKKETNSTPDGGIKERTLPTRKSVSSLKSVLKDARRGSLFIRRFSSSSNRERLRNRKAIRTLGIIVIVFTFCWLPFFILTFIRPFVCDNPESKDCIPVWLVRLVLWLGYLNSALNPFIYIGFSPDLRETFRFLICCKCTNVDRRLAQRELHRAIEEERKASLTSRVVTL